MIDWLVGSRTKDNLFKCRGSWLSFWLFVQRFLILIRYWNLSIWDHPPAVKFSPMIQYSRSLCSTRAQPLWFTWKQLVLKKWILVFKMFFNGIYEQECPWNSFHTSCNIWEGKQSSQSNLNRISRNSKKWTNISSLPVLV